MKKKSLIFYFLFVYLIKYSSTTLVDGIVTLSWTASGSSPAVDRFLTNNTQIQLRILCNEPHSRPNATQGIPKQVLNKEHETAKVQISGRIGRIVGCLPLQADTFMANSQLSAKQENKEGSNQGTSYYDNLWERMEQRTFDMIEVTCAEKGDLQVQTYTNMTAPKITTESKKNRKHRSADEDNKTPLQAAITSQIENNILRTWADGYYIIEISPPMIENNNGADLDIDVVVYMKNRYGGYITADEHPALVFYAVMCGIYALFAILWAVWCAFYWRELLKIQFWIGGVILMGMIEKIGFLVEYDTVNRHGFKVHFAIVTAEVLSCAKRTVARMLVIIVALGYGIVKPRLGPLKQKVFGMGILYFGIATTEALLRINTKNDETNNRVLISRIPLAVIDATIYYWIFTGLVATARTLKLRNNIVKLNVYRHFTNTMIFAIAASLLFMIWSLKSHFFTMCITDWKEFWVDDAFWHILFSLILLVIMFLFRPSNNNQRYAFVPLLDPSDNEDDEFNEDDDKESAVFDSVTMRKASNIESGAGAKNKKQQQAFLNREANVAGSATGTSNNAFEDALTFVENNIPTSIADQALQAMDSEDEIVNTKLERSKMQ